MSNKKIDYMRIEIAQIIVYILFSTINTSASSPLFPVTRLNKILEMNYKENNSSSLVNIPNILSVSRIAVIPVFMTTFSLNMVIYCLAIFSSGV